MKPFYLLLSMSLILAPQVVAQENVATDKAQRERDATVAALVRLIGSQLNSANSWDVRYQPQYDLVKVESSESVLVTLGPGVNFSADEILKREPKRVNPSFAFRVEPFVSPAQYKLFKAENAEITRKLAQMRTQMNDIGGKFDSYMPRNANEKRRVDEYERVKSMLHHLPKFYFRDISLSWTLPYNNEGFPAYIWGQSPGSLDENQLHGLPQWQLQQEQIARATLKLLTRYEPLEVE